MAAVLRAVAMSVAASSAMTVDRVEDVALAVNEAFRGVVTSVADDDRIECGLEARDGSIDVEVVVSSPSAATSVELDALGSTILSGVTDRYELSEHSGITFLVSNRD